MNLMFLLFLYLIGFAVLGIERLIFALWNWSLYKQFGFFELLQTFVAGLRFDLVALSICIAIPILVMLPLSVFAKPLAVRRTGLALFAIIFVALNTLNIVDIEFINFMGRRFTLEALWMMREVPGKFSDIIFFYWKLASLWLVVHLCFLLVLWKLRNPLDHERRFWPKSGIAGAVTSFFLLVFVAVGARGGLQTKPINFVHAQLFAVPALNTLTMNTIFTFTQTLKRAPLPRDKFFEDRDKVLPLLNGSLSAPSWLDGRRPSQPQNIMIIVLESFSYENMGWPHGDKGYTPFLDSLAKKGILFRNAYANGRRSIEGIAAIVGGVPSLMAEPFISSQYMTNTFLGMGTLAGKLDYHTAFFHGAKNGTMYFDRFMVSAGVKNYFGLNEYPRPEETDGSWGIWDEPFFLWTVEKINQFPKKPFISVLFSLTSHHPYRIPPRYEGQIAEGKLDIHKSIVYTDMSVRKFFEAAEKQPWYKDTLFIVTADHTYKAFRPEYDNDLGKYRVPLIFFHPQMNFEGLDAQQVVSHADILPTVIDFLKIPIKDKNYLGQSVFVPGDRIAINFNDDRYLLAARDYFMEYTRGGDFRMFSLEDMHQLHPLLEPRDRFEVLKQKTQAHIQYFNEGLWDNRLYYPAQ